MIQQLSESEDPKFFFEQVGLQRTYALEVFDGIG
jgi:hypothetical protein